MSEDATQTSETGNQGQQGQDQKAGHVALQAFDHRLHSRMPFEAWTRPGLFAAALPTASD